MACKWSLNLHQSRLLSRSSFCFEAKTLAKPVDKAPNESCLLLCLAVVCWEEADRWDELDFCDELESGLSKDVLATGLTVSAFAGVVDFVGVFDLMSVDFVLKQENSKKIFLIYNKAKTYFLIVESTQLTTMSQVSNNFNLAWIVIVVEKYRIDLFKFYCFTICVHMAYLDNTKFILICPPNNNVSFIYLIKTFLLYIKEPKV